MSNTTSQQVKVAVNIILAVGDTIRELGRCPAGHLYAPLMGKISLEQFNKIISILEGAKLIKQTQVHELIWIGPKQ